MNPRDSHEPLGGLGKKVEMPEPPKDPVEVAPGIFKGPDGKLYTDIAPPPAQPVPIPFPC
jgi:hypothetical protein